jgi:hypothetical protein
MSVEFDNEVEINPMNPRIMESKASVSSSGLTGWLIRSGYAKDENKAAKILLLIVVIAIGLSIVTTLIYFLSIRRSAEITAPAGYEVIYPKNGPPRLKKI